MGYNTINTNTPAISSARMLSQTQRALTRNMEKMSSMLRINKASDDAAGLAIADRFRAQAMQYSTEMANYQSGYNAAETAAGGLDTQNDAMVRIRDLAVQAGNGTLTDEQRATINDEAQQLMAQIDETAQNTEFNGTKLLASNQTVQLDSTGDVNLSLMRSDTTSLGLGGVDLTTQAGAQSALNTIDTALSKISQNRSSLGAQQNRFEYSIENLAVQYEYATTAESDIRDMDAARAMMDQTSGLMRQQSGIMSLMTSLSAPQALLRLFS